MAIKVIMDVDTGSDDAVAIMTAATSPAIDLVAICTVWGNQAVENTTDSKTSMPAQDSGHPPENAPAGSRKHWWNEQTNDRIGRKNE